MKETVQWQSSTQPEGKRDEGTLWEIERETETERRAAQFYQMQSVDPPVDLRGKRKPHSDAENTRQREFLCAFSAMKHISCLNASINWSAATKSSTRRR